MVSALDQGPTSVDAGSERLLRVELGGPLEALAEVSNPGHGALRAQILRVVGERLRAFGIPAYLYVELGPSREGQTIGVEVAGHRRSIDAETLTLLAGAVIPEPYRQPPGSASAVALPHITADAEGAEEVYTWAARFVAEAVGCVLARHAADVFEEVHAQVLCERARWVLTPQEWATLSTLDASRLAGIVRALLGLGISVAHYRRVLGLLAEHVRLGHADDAVCERMAGVLSTQAITVRVHPDYLNDALVRDGVEPVVRPDSAMPGLHADTSRLSIRDERLEPYCAEQFATLRDRFYWDTGLRLPEVEFLPDPTLPPTTFSIGFNDWFHPPQRGIGRGEFLVLDTSSSGPWLLDPETGTAGAVVAGNAWSAGGPGTTVVGRVEYLMRAIARVARSRAGALITLPVVETELALLDASRSVEPLLAVRHVGVVLLARTLRMLAEEGFSIRDLARILERLLLFDAVAADTLDHIVIDDRLARDGRLAGCPSDEADFAQYVRMGFKYAITLQNSRQNQLFVYLLDHDIELELSEHAVALRDPNRASPLAPERLDAIVAAIRATTTTVPGEVPAPILTSAGIRALVRELVAEELPRLPVLCYDELRPDVSITVLDRVVAVD